MSDVYQGAVAPESYVLDITPGASGLNLTTVSAAVLKVRKSNGAEVDWAATLSNQAAATLTLTHQFVGGDLDVDGSYSVYAALTVPGGTVRTEPRTLQVKPRFGYA